MAIKYKRLLGLFLLLGLLGLLLVPSQRVSASDSYEITASTDDLWIILSASNYHGAFIKWNVSSVPTGRTILSATMSLYFHYNGGNFDDDLRLWLFSNQTWVETGRPQMSSADDLTTQSSKISEEQDYTGITGTGRISFDVQNQFSANYGNANFSLRIEDPDYLLGTAGGTVSQLYTSNDIHLGGNDITERAYIYSHDASGGFPKLTIILQSIPAGTFQLTYEAPTIGDQSTFLTPQKHWNATQLLYVAFLYVYEDGTNVTMSGIPTTYSFSYINQNTTYTDDITANGQMVFTGLYEGTYEVVVNPNQDWHTLHISLYAPDGVGLMWESFQIYINNTRIPYPPEYRLESGYYEYAVNDYFSQTVLSGSFTIYDSDPEEVYQNWEVPLYLVSFHNADLAPYRLEITRNSITREYPAPPKGEAQVRLYGLSTNIPYTITIYQAESGAQIGQPYTLNVPNAPLAQYLNFDDDEGRISFPSYADQFVAVKQTVVQAVAGQNLLLLLGFGGILLTIIVNRLGLLATIFRKPIISERRRHR